MSFRLWITAHNTKKLKDIKLFKSHFVNEKLRIALFSQKLQKINKNYFKKKK